MKTRMLLGMAFAGALVGYVLMSPFVMYVSHLVHMDRPFHAMSTWEVFTPGLLSWSLSFTLFGGLIGLVLGILYHRAREGAEEARGARDDLKWANEELIALNEEMEASNEELRAATEELTSANEKLRREIDLRQETEAALRTERDRVQGYLDIAGVMLVVIDADQAVSLINRRGCDILGYTEAEVIGRNWFDNFLPERMRGEVKGVFDRLMAGEVEPAEYFENTVLTRGGEERLIAWHNTVLREEDGSVVGTLSSGEDVTESRKAQEAVRESEERFRQFFEKEPAYCYMVSPEGVILDVNHAALVALGYEREELVGRPLRVIYPPEALPQMEGLFARWQANGTLKNEEVTIITKAGKRRTVLLNADEVKNIDGTTLHSISVQQDITERKKAEDALEASERNYRSLVDNALVGVYKSNLAGEILYTNDALALMMGYGSTDEMTADGALVRYRDPEDRKALVAALKKEGKVVNFELDLLTRTGGTKNVLVSAALEGDTLSGMIQDITDRKGMEDEIRRRSDLLLSLNRFLQMPLGEMTLEEMLEGSIEKIVSIPWLALESKGCIFLVEGEEGSLAMKAQRGLAGPLLEECAQVPFGDCLCGRAAQTGKIVFADCVDERHETRFDSMAPHGHYCVPIITSEKRVIGVINLYVKDGHRHDDREEEFLTSIANVLGGVIQRKQAEDSLKGYAQDLEEANRMKDLFTDIMRHDLLNPAGAARSFIELVMDEEEDAERKGHLEIARDSITKLIDMVESAALLSRIEETTGLISREMNLSHIVKDASNSLGHQAGEADMEVHILADRNCPVRADPMIENVFTNLVSNAIKYAPEGKRIEIDIKDKDDSWLVYVKDWGEGISDEYKEKLFTRFERRGKEGVKGAGLGLAIAKRIVDLHGGRIWVEDNPEGGSIFYVRLPKGGT